MTLILQVVAAALTIIGAVTLYWGTSPSLLSLGNTVMVVGAVIAASGIVLFGLSAVLGQLGLLADKLDELRWALDGARMAAPVHEDAASDVQEEEPAPAPRVEPVIVPPPAALPAEPPPVEVKPAEPVFPARPVPPSRESFGLRPLATGAAGVAAGAAAGLVATRPAEAEPEPEKASGTPEADAASEVPVADIGAMLGRTPEPQGAEKPAEKPLEEAVEELKAEVKAAEKDVSPEVPEPADLAEDHMVSLEKLLLGDAPARAPAEVDTEDFMARLRETISRPIVPPAAPEPEPEPEAEAEPEPQAEPEPEPEPAPAEAEKEEEEPLFSIEAELERALKASLEEPAAPPPPAREPRLVPPPPPEPPAPREERMTTLARDFPELNDLLSPKRPDLERPAPQPSNALMDDLKSIFETASAPPAREEPAVAPPPPPPAPPPAPASAPILREGVIAGIPFRLFGDGSIEADLESGTTRFASLKDFRAHVGG